MHSGIQRKSSPLHRAGLPGRDPEDRAVASDDVPAIREKMLDKTLADSYPASDPPSTIPNPSTDSICLEKVVATDLITAA